MILTVHLALPFTAAMGSGRNPATGGAEQGDRRVLASNRPET